MTLEITIPIPHKATHPNARVHWAAKARHTKKQKVDGMVAGRCAIITKERNDGHPFKAFRKASVEAVFFFRTKHSRDHDNLSAWLKASLDGIAAAGVVGNDRAFSAPETSYSHDKLNPRCVITITPI